ncbi:MAG: FHA domain-containing protein, partial [Chloroflexota bacterium]
IYEIRLAASSSVLTSDDMDVILDQLSSRILNTAERLGLHINAMPQVSISSSKHLESTQILSKYSPVEDDDDQATRVIARGGGRSDVEEACLISLSSSVVASIGKIMSIGSDQSNDLVISSAGVLPRHALIRRVGYRYMLYDLGSPSGILLGDTRVRESLLEPGDVITIGNEHLVFSLDEDEPEGFPSDTPLY